MKAPEIKITYSHHVPASQRLKIDSANTACRFARSLYDDDKIEHIEQAYLILMNRSCRVLGTMLLSTGSLDMTIIDRRLVFQTALKANAACFILVHNHPSGSAQPSSTDDKLTKQIRECGKLMDIDLIDHIIVTPEGNYYSYSSEGNL
jgi:DNA repair protein RadC